MPSPFSLLQRGTAALRTVVLPMPSGVDVSVDVRPLNGMELGSVIARAREYATANGVKEPKEGDELYRLGQMAHTLAIACSKPGEPDTLFFDSADEVLAGLDPDRIVLLYEEQQAWQDRCAPRAVSLDGKDVLTIALEVAGWEEGQPDPLLHLRPSLRPIWARTLASLYFASLSSRSDTSSASAEQASPS